MVCSLWEGRGELTGCGADALVEGFFVSAREGTEGFVAGGEENYCDEGEDEGGGRADVPLSEDDAEVLGIPGKEHLEILSAGGWTGDMMGTCVHAAHVLHASITMVHISMAHSLVVHTAVIHVCVVHCIFCRGERVRYREVVVILEGNR